MDKKSMYKISYGLFVLSTKLGERCQGCIINTAMQVTTTPNRITITVNKENLTHNVLMYTKEFNISVISEEADFELFRHFGFQSGRDTDKFADFKDQKNAPNGMPVVTKGTNAWISGKVIDTVDLGTHTMFIADVTDGEVMSGAPSATYAYYQDNIKPKPTKKPDETGYRCRICGYVHKGEELPEDFICPICKHGADDFEKI
ncbi:MAG: flavin reductase [Oscillospiraceae bacterium]|nr:flavin reductase [Oscillospiraceae bacterium]